MMNLINDLAFLALKVVIVVSITLITKFVVPALKNYIEQRQSDLIFNLMSTAVRAAEQTITESGKGSVKKELVTNLVTKWLRQKGIELDPEQLDKMIEECVYLVTNAK